MTFSCPSFFAAATRALNPPPAEADVAVDQFALELPELPPVAAVLELLDPLLQPAASRMLPIAAPTATIALVARKITPPHAAPARQPGAILARQVHMVASQVEQIITFQRPAAVPSVSNRQPPGVVLRACLMTAWRSASVARSPR